MPWKKYLKITTPVDFITIVYICITAILIVFGKFRVDGIVHILTRIIFLFLIGLLVHFNQTLGSNKAFRFIRNFYPLMLLGYFYPETDYLNNIFFPNLDSFIANLEVTIFGGHPSVWFSAYFHWKWFNELMNFGYFSYYFLIFIVCYSLYLKSIENFRYGLFIICMSFYMYYILFILFPVAGPQFYLTPPDNQLPNAYFFSWAIRFVHDLGEGPTGAFPSSHVGIVLILIYLAYKFTPKLLKWLIPVSILLILSTVYIKAHYVIDVIAGVLSFPTMYWISSTTYQRIKHYFL